MELTVFPATELRPAEVRYDTDSSTIRRLAGAARMLGVACTKLEILGGNPPYTAQQAEATALKLFDCDGEGIGERMDLARHATVSIDQARLVHDAAQYAYADADEECERVYGANRFRSHEQLRGNFIEAADWWKDTAQFTALPDAAVSAPTAGAE